MKVIISENERGFLFKNGVYQRMLTPGKHQVWSMLGESVVKREAGGRLYFDDVNMEVLLEDEEISSKVAILEVPDDRVAVRFADGRIKEALGPGKYVYWNIYEKNTFEVLDITLPESAGTLPLKYISVLPTNLYIRRDIDEYETGLLFYNGEFQKKLKSGQHYFWNYRTKVEVVVIDNRTQQMDIPGQEILTADKVSVRVNFASSFQIKDPLSIVTKLKDYYAQIYVFVQLTLREFIGKYRFDDLIRQKYDLGRLILEKLKEREDEFFVEFTDAGLKDVILPGEIRDIMNTVLIAEKAAQASVITRREETAATKSLLETAKLMDENTTLYKLKELEYLEKICDKVGNISIESGGGILKNLREIISR